MAIGDIKIYGKTNANVSAEVAVEASDRLFGDTTLINDITNNIIGNISHTNSQILDEQVPTLQASLSAVINQRSSKLGSLDAEGHTSIAGNFTFSDAFNSLKFMTLSNEGTMSGISGNFNSIQTKYYDTLSQVDSNETRYFSLNDDATLTSLKTAQTYIETMKTEDDTTIAGFTTTVNTQLSVFAPGGQQTKTNGMIYKDENSATYYRMYISAGNLLIEEVAAPAL